MTRTFILLLISKLLFFTNVLSAQPIWQVQKRGTAISVEFLKSYFVDSNSSAATSVLFISGQHPLSQTLTIMVDIPFAHHGYKDDFGLNRLQSSTVIGNPHLGVKIQKPASAFFAELGLRLPLSTDRDEFYETSRATEIGYFTDPDRFEALALYGLSGTGRLNYLRELPSGFRLHLRSGLSGGVSPDQDYGPAGFSTLDYGIQLGYRIEQVSISGGVAGRYLLGGQTFHMQRFGGLGRFVQQVAVSASMSLGTVRPGIHFRLPIDNFLNDEIHFVLGLNLGIRLK